MPVLVVVCHGFTRENVRLQPWRYIYELSLRALGDNRVVIITDGPQEENFAQWDEGLDVLTTPSLSPRQLGELAGVVKRLQPERIWWSVTPRSIVYRSLYRKLSCPVTALITCPIYSWGQLLRAQFTGVPFHQLRSLWMQRLVPRRWFVSLLNESCLEKICTQSRSNLEILVAAGVRAEKISVVPVGIDADDRKGAGQETIDRARQDVAASPGNFTCLYLGAIRPIRGFDALMRAFVRAARKDMSIRLVVLARGADSECCRSIEQRLQKEGLLDRAHVVGGWLDKEDVRAYIAVCDTVVLPFVMVPSDVPIAILEALAQGKPVISTRVDGIPELVDGNGIVVDPYDDTTLEKALLSLAADRERGHRYAVAAAGFMRNYPDWDGVWNMFDAVDATQSSQIQRSV